MDHQPLLLFDAMDWLVPLLRFGGPLLILLFIGLGLRALIRSNFPKKSK
jgi:hypothetical protein